VTGPADIVAGVEAWRWTIVHPLAPWCPHLDGTPGVCHYSTRDDVIRCAACWPPADQPSRAACDRCHQASAVPLVEAEVRVPCPGGASCTGYPCGAETRLHIGVCLGCVPAVAAQDDVTIGV
jgi:hypothetical protein